MNFIDSILLGIVEGLTEFLPISSTGHLMIASKILGIKETVFSGTFEIAIQAGAMIAVVFLYTSLILKHKELLLKIAVAFLPTMIVGLTLYSYIKNFLLSNIIIVFIALIVGGILILVVEKKSQPTESRELSTLTYKEALKLGLLQVFAFIPGVSRSGATIIGGLALRYPRIFLVEFAFLLALPTIFGAPAYDLYKNSTSLDSHQYTLIAIGGAVSCIVAYGAMKTFLSYLKKNTFTPFAYYRIIVGVLGLVYFL